MNNLNIPSDKLDSLIDIAGKKLGRDPDELRSDLQAGKLDNVLGSMNPQAANQINSLLQNPEALKSLLNNEQVKNMLNGLMGGQK